MKNNVTEDRLHYFSHILHKQDTVASTTPIQPLTFKYLLGLIGLVGRRQNQIITIGIRTQNLGREFAARTPIQKCTNKKSLPNRKVNLENKKKRKSYVNNEERLSCLGT